MALFTQSLGNVPIPATQSPSTVPPKTGNDRNSSPEDAVANPYDINDPKATKKVKDRIEERYRKANNRRWLFELSWLRNCIAAGTQIPLLDGRSLPIEQLVGAKDAWTYGFDMEALRIVPVKVEDCWSNGRKECIEVFLDNGKSFVCTADHQILTWFGYKAAGELEAGTPLVPLKQSYYTKGVKENNYSITFQPYDCEWQSTHRMVAEWIHGDIPEDFVVHHRDENKRNNHPDNLEPMCKRKHSRMTLEQHKEKIVAGVRAFCATPENREKKSANAKRQWAENYDEMHAATIASRQDPEYRKRMSEIQKEYWARPENAARRNKLRMQEHWEKKGADVNCRVVRIERVGEREVFDMSIPATNNFALDCGIFVHNCLYYLGVQWVRVDWPGREVRNLSLPGNFPRAITNTYAKVNKDLMAAITSGDVPLMPVPSTDDPKDIGTAEVAERVREVIDEEVGTRSLKRDLGFWLVLTGNSFLDPYYDYNPKYGTKPVPQFACSQCGATTTDATKPCTECGGLQPPAPQVDETGAPIPPPPQPPHFIDAGTKDLPIGKLCFRVYSPYEVYWDNTVRIGAGTHHWKILAHRYEIEDAKGLWPTFAKKITEDMNEPMKVSRNYLVAIAYAGSYLSGVSGSGEASARENNRKMITAWEYRELPSADYPQGLRAIQLGDFITELGPLPTEYSAGQSKGEKFDALVHFYMENSGGAWGKPRANDLCSIQARRNIIASNLQLTAQRTGAPKLMAPIGSGFKNATGEAGQFVEYKPISFGGTSMAEPHYLEAALGNVQPLVLLIKQLDDEMEAIAGTHFVTGADVPSGVTAASALSFLGEKANQAIAPIKEVYVEAWRLAYKYGIELARQHWTDERILAFLGANKEWQFLKFKAADLKGAVDMRIDYDAMFPKSQATERANIMALVQMGAVQPASDPEQCMEVLQAFGETKMRASMEGATAQAIREWDNFLNNDIPPQLIPIVQDAALHLLQHKKDAQSQEFEQLLQTNKDKADIWIAHIQATATELEVASMPMGGPGGEPSPSAPGGPSGSKTPPGHPGSQHGSQAGAAGGNLAEPASIRKGQSAASNGGAPAGPGLVP